MTAAILPQVDNTVFFDSGVSLSFRESMAKNRARGRRSKARDGIIRTSKWRIDVITMCGQSCQEQSLFKSVILPKQDVK